MAWTHDQMAARAAQELQDGFYVNLGIGLPTLVANHVRPGIEVAAKRNGMLGIGSFPRGPVDSYLINAEATYHAAGNVYLRLAHSFAMILGGKSTVIRPMQ